jgi:hypothetical protein
VNDGITRRESIFLGKNTSYAGREMSSMRMLQASSWLDAERTITS